jgi:hypothetical protein
MAITASYSKRNDGADFVWNDATASQTIDFGDKPDERVVLLVENANTVAGQTATVTISKGDFLGNALGDLAVIVAKGDTAAIGPLESVRFKNSASEVTVGVAVTNSGTVSNVKIGVVKLP